MENVMDFMVTNVKTEVVQAEGVNGAEGTDPFVVRPLQGLGSVDGSCPKLDKFADFEVGTQG